MSSTGGDPGAAVIGRRMIIATAVILVVVAVTAVAWFSRHGATAETAGADGSGNGVVQDTGVVPTPAVDGGSAPAPAPVEPVRDPEQEALAVLQQRHAASLGRLVLDGRWVAQVASKSIGITDPLQTAANGTHTFYAADILAESDAATRSVSSSSVLVLQSGDFGKRSAAADGQPYWITVVDAGFAASDGVESWCARTFSSLSGEALANACAARTLSPPHD